MCLGKQGKWSKKNPCQGKHGEFGNFAKTQGIRFAQVVNMSRKLSRKSYFFLSLINLPSLFCVNHVNWHRKILLSDRGKKRENTGNLKMQFEWLPGINHVKVCTCTVWRSDICESVLLLPSGSVQHVVLMFGSI